MPTFEAARRALPGVELAGLIDPEGAPLDAALRSCFDAIYLNAYAAGSPWCLVRVQPGAGDPLFAARLVQMVPSVAVEPVLPGEPLERALSGYWLRRSDRVVERGELWAAVAQIMRRPDPPSARAVFTAEPDGALAAALRQSGARVFGADLVALLSPRFGRTLFIIEGTAAEAGLLELLRRFGGDAVLTGTCLLGAYGDAQAVALASAELGRPVPAGELAQWRAGIARPAALLLGEAAAAARTLHVPSAWLAAEVKARFGREAQVLPLTLETAPVLPYRAGDGVIAAAAAGLQAEACVWALELLRFWGVSARMALDCPAAERPALAGLAERLGVADRLAFGAETDAEKTGAVTAMLAMRGDGRGATGLVAALAGGRWCVGSRCLAESMDAPPWLEVVPDQVSPPLLAQALRAALAAARPSGPVVAAWGIRHRMAEVLLG